MEDKNGKKDMNRLKNRTLTKRIICTKKERKRERKKERKKERKNLAKEKKCALNRKKEKERKKEFSKKEKGW